MKDLVLNYKNKLKNIIILCHIKVNKLYICLFEYISM